MILQGVTEFELAKTKVIIYEHRLRLVKYLGKFIEALSYRAGVHDESKLSPEELLPYASVVSEFGKHKFGTPEYDKIRESLSSALQHHYHHNRHHPEHFETGINGMDLVDLLEMVADWKSATQNTGGNGDIMKSISVLSEKYDISPQLKQILINTVNNFGLGT